MHEKRTFPPLELNGFAVGRKRVPWSIL
jgi:hypothetical protein